jgi:hypothetical protein
MTERRKVYMVLSPRALSYARDALESLFRNSAETLHLSLITDEEHDKAQLSEAMEGIDCSAHSWKVYAETELADREQELFGKFANIRALRRGHPCWRKITDPFLLSAPGEELVLLDPDLYFPNRFAFEATPKNGVLLMWQQPNCLFPPEVVKTAMQKNIRLAHHVDIGVAHWRADADLEWLDWLVGQLGGDSLPRVMHIEAIVWAALAMRIGGGHLDPRYWKCWRRSPVKRIMKKLGVDGVRILRSEPWDEIKCFHAGGEAKSWLHAARQAGLMDAQTEQVTPGSAIPFTELTPAQFARERAFKSALQAVGYYQIFRPA